MSSEGFLSTTLCQCGHIRARHDYAADCKDCGCELFTPAAPAPSGTPADTPTPFATLVELRQSLSALWLSLPPDSSAQRQAQEILDRLPVELVVPTRRTPPAAPPSESVEVYALRLLRIAHGQLDHDFYDLKWWKRQGSVFDDFCAALSPPAAPTEKP